MKTSYKLALIVFLLCCLTNVQFAASIALSEKTAAAGAPQVFSVTLTDAPDFAGGAFVIKFDPAILSFTGIASLGISDSFLVSSELRGDEIVIGIARARGIQMNSAILFGINFRVSNAAEAGSVAALSWQKCELWDAALQEIPCETADGLLRVSGIDVYPNPITPHTIDGFNDAATFVIPDSITGNTIIRIYNVGGSLIRTLSGSGATLQWDGSRENGDIARPGVYLYLVLAKGTPFSKGTITIMQ